MHRSAVSVASVFLLLACGTEVEPGIEPPQPTITQRSFPPDPIDHGVFADVATGQPAIWIEWRSDSTRKTTGFIVYRADSLEVDESGMLRNAIEVGRKEPSNDLIQKIDTLHRDTTLIEYGNDYFYQVRAFNRSATNRYTFSKPSEPREFTLLRPPVLFNPTGASVAIPAEGLDFSWEAPDIREGGGFQVIIEELNPPRVFYASPLEITLDVPTIWEYPDTLEQFKSGVFYRWRVKHIISDGGGSSFWQNFRVE